MQWPHVTAVAPRIVTRSPRFTPVTLRAHLHDGAGALVAEDDRRIVPEGVVQDVEIGPAHPAEGDLDLHLVRSAHRLVNVQDVDVAGPGAYLTTAFIRI